MAKTTADVPPSVASEYKKAPAVQAIAEAQGDGYTKTKAMQKAGKTVSKGQFGLPPSVKSSKGMKTVKM